MTRTYAHARVIFQYFAGFKKCVYKKNETIIRAEDLPQGVYYLLKGFVRVYVLTPEGSELTILIFRPGSVFPMVWAALRVPNAYFYEAMTEVETYRAPIDDFGERLRTDGLFMYEIHKAVITGFHETVTRYRSMMLGNASRRVASVLVMLGNRMGMRRRPQHPAVTFGVTHQQIASLTALTRESVGTELRKFEREGLVRTRYRMCTVTDPAVFRSRYCPDEDDDIPEDP